jgi:biopolymer transport protein ExbD
MRFSKPDPQELELNLTSLIDVVFLLLIFFMVTTTFQQQSKIQINLPEAETSSNNKNTPPIEVAINKDGQVFINEKLIELDNLQLLKKTLNKLNADKKTQILIKADASAPHQSVITIMDIASQVGILSISFATTKLE